MRISDWSSDVCSSDLHVRLIRTMEQLVRHVVAAETGFADVRHRRRRLNAVTHRHVLIEDRIGGNLPVLFKNLDAARIVLAARRQIAQVNTASVDVARVLVDGPRSEERRVGKACVSTCRYRWWPVHYKKKENVDRRQQQR